MVDRQKEFLTYRLCEKPTSKYFQKHRKLKQDVILNSAFIIEKECVNLKTKLLVYDNQLNSFDTLKRPFDCLVNFSGKRQTKTKVSILAASLGLQIQQVHNNIKKFEQESTQKEFSETEQDYYKGIVAYFFDHFLQLSSKYKELETNRVLRESYLQRLLTPSGFDDLEILPCIGRSKGCDELYDSKVVYCLPFVASRWLKPLTQKPNFSKIKELNRVKTTAKQNKNVVETSIDLSASETTFNNSLQYDYQQLVVTKEKRNATQKPFRDVLQSLSDLQHLMDSFVTEIASQSDLCQTIHAVAEDSLDNILKASSELKKLNDGSKNTYRFYLIWYYLCVSLLLLFCDFFLSTHWI
ncbi:uncharacterized protein LOC128882995 [Hylaeus volcanicus]|uniref:uncharacterized protein LOC128882995 n=1 Tax=Hylaeus volcanicus TaxID=313075 RepID=UPI0023B86677|nr:uncharacterized protein LOC128882995 [Hylaeus volcanicus]